MQRQEHLASAVKSDQPDHATIIIDRHKHLQTTITHPLKGRAGTLTNLHKDPNKLTWMHSLAN